MIFRVLEAVFIESAYISREAKMSVSVRAGSPGGAMGASTVEDIVAVPGGMFVRHHGAWNFCPWANVKSARLVDAPAEIIDFVGRGAPDGNQAQAPVGTPAPELERAGAPARGLKAARRSRLGPAPEAPASDADLVGLPQRDAGGVLLSAQPQGGPKMTCPACGGSFVQGGNHVCEKVEA